jgi:hypothetical protein
MSRLEICPAAPTEIYKPFQVIGFEGFFYLNNFESLQVEYSIGFIMND